MATRDGLSVHVPNGHRNNYKFPGQQKREELETEVHVLHKMLDHEQKVHEYMDRLQHRQNGSALSIPDSLPPKMKEILVELAMVENEITRLESQINQLKAKAKHKKEVHSSTKSKELDHTNHHEPSNPCINNKRSNEKAGFETKALHFISKAIKGDYKLSDFSIRDKSMKSKGISNQKEGTFHEDNVSKRSGMLKMPSPLRESRHPTPWPV